MSGEFPINRLANLLLVTTMCSSLFACAGDSDGGSTDTFNLVESAFDSTLSHTDTRRGVDCLQSSCHGGPSTSTKPHFTVAGTVYTDYNTNTPVTKATIKFFSGTATVKLIEVDANGNFYSNDSISWNSSLHVQTLNAQGNLGAQMGGGLPNSSYGGCNSCHSSSASQPFRVSAP